jgi:anti-sigma factor ChrR (cupin superfamily)
MISEQQQEQAALCALGLLRAEEQERFATEVRANAELREFLWSLQSTLDRVILAGPKPAVPEALKGKVLNRIRAGMTERAHAAQNRIQDSAPELQFLKATETTGWKALPIAGAWIKLLSLEPTRGYAVLLGKLDAGVRYPAHVNVGPEDFYILSGDLHVSGNELGPGDFHHADAGSHHGENYSVAGCTLLAVLTVDDPLVSYAMS